MGALSESSSPEGDSIPSFIAEISLSESSSISIGSALLAFTLKTGAAWDAAEGPVMGPVAACMHAKAAIWLSEKPTNPVLPSTLTE